MSRAQALDFAVWPVSYEDAFVDPSYEDHLDTEAWRAIDEWLGR